MTRVRQSDICAFDPDANQIVETLTTVIERFVRENWISPAALARHFSFRYTAYQDLTEHLREHALIGNKDYAGVVGSFGSPQHETYFQVYISPKPDHFNDNGSLPLSERLRYWFPRFNNFLCDIKRWIPSKLTHHNAWFLINYNEDGRRSGFLEVRNGESDSSEYYFFECQKLSTSL